MLTRKNGKMRQFSSYRDNYVSTKEDLDFLVFSLGNLVQKPNNGLLHEHPPGHRSQMPNLANLTNTNVVRYKQKSCKIQIQILQDTNVAIYKQKICKKQIEMLQVHPPGQCAPGKLSQPSHIRPSLHRFYHLSSGISTSANAVLTQNS